MIWQILIATTVDRRPLFEALYAELTAQITFLSLQDQVSIIFDEDQKEKSIGKKRQDLLELSTAKYINYFDSDDWPYPYYIEEIYNSLLWEHDCIGMLIDMTSNGKRPQVCCHSLRYPIWQDKIDGYDYVRNVTHFNPVKRELAIQVGFPDLRFGEDQPYSDGVTKLCKTEIFIDKAVFHYRYSNSMEHNKKYGIS